MKQNIDWRTSGAVMVSIALAMTAFPAFSTAATTAPSVLLRPSRYKIR
jgi:hypothetical protein